MSRMDSDEIRCGGCKKAVTPVVRDMFVNDVHAVRGDYLCPVCNRRVYGHDEAYAHKRFQEESPECLFTVKR